MRKKHSSPGMFTVEMTILFPIIFFTIVGLIYIGILYYQTMVTRTAAMRTASRVSYCWDALGREGAFQNGSVTAFDYTRHDPYGSVINAVTGSNTQEKNALSYFNWVLGKNPSLLGNREKTKDPRVAYHWGLLAPTIEVSVSKHFTNPLGNLLNQIGIAAEEDRSITATVNVTDPVEFIRLAGIVYDTVKSKK